MFIFHPKSPTSLIKSTAFLLLLISAFYFFKRNFTASELEIQKYCMNIIEGMSLAEALDMAHSRKLEPAHERKNAFDVSITVIEARQSLTSAWSVCTLRHDKRNILSASYDPWYH